MYTILANVFLAPWGLTSTQQAGSVLLAIVALLAKATAIGAVVVVIDNSFAKLRLFKITEFVAGNEPDQFPGDVEHDTIGDHAEPLPRSG